MIFTNKTTKVRYCETDQMGFVHHSNYVKFFELARIEWLDQMGISYAQMEKDGILMPVVSVNLFFKKPLYFGDTFQVTVLLDEMPKATLIFSYKITNQLQEEICTGMTKLAFLDAHRQRPIRCPKTLSDVFIDWNNTQVDHDQS